MTAIRQLLYGTSEIYKPRNGAVLDLQGWGSYHSVFGELIRAHKPKLILEVGTWKGASAINMANIRKEIDSDFEIVCIDTFLGSWEHWHQYKELLNIAEARPRIYQQFLDNVTLSYHEDVITPFPIDSTNAYETLNRFNVKADFVYIDGGHDYASVDRDLHNYWSLLNPGGILLCDDYSDSHSGVGGAIRDFQKTHDYIYPAYHKDEKWWTQKT